MLRITFQFIHENTCMILILYLHLKKLNMERMLMLENCVKILL